MSIGGISQPPRRPKHAADAGPPTARSGPIQDSAHDPQERVERGKGIHRSVGNSVAGRTGRPTIASRPPVRGLLARLSRSASSWGLRHAEGHGRARDRRAARRAGVPRFHGGGAHGQAGNPVTALRGDCWCRHANHPVHSTQPATSGGISEAFKPGTSPPAKAGVAGGGASQTHDEAAAASATTTTPRPARVRRDRRDGAATPHSRHPGAGRIPASGYLGGVYSLCTRDNRRRGLCPCVAATIRAVGPTESKASLTLLQEASLRLGTRRRQRGCRAETRSSRTELWKNCERPPAAHCASVTRHSIKGIRLSPNRARVAGYARRLDTRPPSRGRSG